jgi:hypothetical protein
MSAHPPKAVQKIAMSSWYDLRTRVPTNCKAFMTIGMKMMVTSSCRRSWCLINGSINCMNAHQIFSRWSVRPGLAHRGSFWYPQGYQGYSVSVPGLFQSHEQLKFCLPWWAKVHTVVVPRLLAAGMPWWEQRIFQSLQSSDKGSVIHLFFARPQGVGGWD